MDNLKKMIRTVPDFPKPGIQFYDITTLLKEPYGLRTTIDRLTELIDDPNIDTVIGIEARGFIFAPALAYRLGAGFVPVRKPRKLPAEIESISYELEMAKIRSRFIRTRSGMGIASSLPTICWPRAGRLAR